jgi:hypothetical protein
MTFRDDHQATLDRNVALEQDLDLAQEKIEELQQERDMERAERKRLEAKLGARPAEPPAISRSEPRREYIPIWREDNDERRSDLVGVGISIAIFIGMVLFVLALAMAR